MFRSSVLVSTSPALTLLALLLSGCEGGALEIRTPGTPDEPGSVLEIDLLPGPIDAPNHIRADEVLSMQVGVRNRGSRGAGPGWIIRVFLSSDPDIDPSDRQIDQFPATRDLAPGGQDSYLRNKKLSDVLPGTYYLGTIVDVTGVVPEISESNNILAAPVSLTVLPATAGP